MSIVLICFWYSALICHHITFLIIVGRPSSTQLDRQIHTLKNAYLNNSPIHALACPNEYKHLYLRYKCYCKLNVSIMQTYYILTQCVKLPLYNFSDYCRETSMYIHWSVGSCTDVHSRNASMNLTVSAVTCQPCQPGQLK